MASFWQRINPLSSKSYTLPIANKNFRSGFMDFITGTPGKRENVSTLRKEQEPLFQQLQNAAMNQGAGGAFGTAADYYRNLMSDNPADLQAFSAPELRRFNEQIIPGLSEQFAGMGAGGLSSSSFRNAAVNAGTDLSERLGALRAQLRQHGAQGLMNIGSQGLQSYSQNMETEAPTEGLLSQLAPAIGTAAGAFLGGPAGAAAGYQAGNMFKNSFGGTPVSKNTSPYGVQPQIYNSANGFNLPRRTF